MKDKMIFNEDTIPSFLYQRAKSSPRDIVYRFPEFEQEYSWSRMWDEVSKLAKGFLRFDIKKGDRIALLMRGRIELILSIYAAASIGAIAVPLNTYSIKNDLINYLKDSRPKMLILDTEGQHSDYLNFLDEIIAECDANSEIFVPATIFVLQDKEKLKLPYHPFTELKNVNGDENSDYNFLLACQSISKDDPIIIFYTSGTTGVPKAVVRSTASFLTSFSNSNNRVHSIITKIGDHITKHFSIMNLLPLYHLGGFGTIFITLKACNICVTMLSHFNPKNAIKVVGKQKCRFLIGTPFMIQQMLLTLKENQSDLNSLLGLVFTSSPVNISIIRRVRDELNLLFFIVGYGSTEAGAVANGTCFLNRKRFSIWSVLYKVLKNTNLLSGVIPYEQFEKCSYSLAGKIDKDVEVQIIDPKTGKYLKTYEQGEICIRSHRVMRYVNEENNHTNYLKAGWYKSGDLGFLDANGLLTITDRIKRIISRGGEKISPAEIESVLLTLKGVNDAFVIGIPDELYGEQICACVIPTKGTNLSPKEIQNQLNTYLATFKIPKYILFFSEFPMSSSGKISSMIMQQLVLEQLKGFRKNA